jgi:hypothetical protein
MRLLQHGVNGHRTVENLLQYNVENGENQDGFLWGTYVIVGVPLAENASGPSPSSLGREKQRAHGPFFLFKLFRHCARVSRCFLREVLCSGLAVTGL